MMTWQNGRLAFAAILALAAGLLVQVGCSKTEEGKVSVTGTVTLDGQPVEGAAVAFISEGGASLATGKTDSSGQFTLNAAPGPNAVTVSKMEGSAPPPGDEPALMPSSAEQQAAPAPKSLVPAKYGDPKTSGLNINVKEGMAGVDLSLSSQ